MTFSQKHGFAPKIKPLQLGEMDADLANSLWNAFYFVYVVNGMNGEWLTHETDMDYSKYKLMFLQLWADLLKRPLDGLPETTTLALDAVKEWFYDKRTAWFQRYDFLQFIAEGNYQNSANGFIARCNMAMERESSGWRFVGNQIAPITNEHEIKTVEDAEQCDEGPLAPVGEHVRAAVKLLSNRQHADYRNSIKESISAVESMCKLLSNESGGGLDKAIGKLKGMVEIHPAMVQGFLKLYGYTSDEGGIRHAMMEENDSDYEDAKYMLVSCSAFVNYLVGKAIKAGLLKTGQKK